MCEQICVLYVFNYFIPIQLFDIISFMYGVWSTNTETEPLNLSILKFKWKCEHCWAT